ncbi:hypothetical protein LOH54_11515 [Sulfurimonas sp. HSL-3221]|uniref:hypothetical protein n=1 Tax=Thiomicrolovo sulfuroxydans TaxID=2894755 RepID=UPI001E3C6AB8|nr:hypothetical protein [Sulfurimonas sp. HSL-3221]UFS62267.1 hypothetical protein LOH54_11515 [Sulfurimonas sp. HSL-3221]
MTSYKIKRKNIVNYILVALLIICSGFLSISNNSIFLISTFIISGIYFIYYKRAFHQDFLVIMGTLLILYLIQTLQFQFISLNTIFGVFIRISIAFFVLSVVGKEFIDVYLKLMATIVIVSLIFYIPLNIVPGLDVFLIEHFSLGEFSSSYLDVKHTIGIYTVYQTAELHRNPGPFWEPGAFAGYIIIALIFNLVKTKSFKNKYSILLSVGLFSTLSSTGYIAFGILIMSYIAFINRNIKYKYFALILVVPSFIYFFLSSSFLYDKIEEQIVYAMQTDTRFSENTQRFINVLRDFHDIQGYEFFGRGPNENTRFDIDNNIIIRTNGFTDMLVEYGIFFILLLYMMFYKSFSNLFRSHGIKNSLYVFANLFVITILLQTEIYFDFALLWSTLFFRAVYPTKLLHATT